MTIYNRLCYIIHQLDYHQLDYQIYYTIS